MRVIGLDVGEKRIGVAKAESATRIAVPAGFINVDGTEWQEIEKIAKLNNTNLFVLGLPRSNEGNETAQTLFVKNFAKALVEKIPEAKIRFQDESLTSVEAESRLKKRQKKYEKGDIDAEAASIILQDFMENYTGDLDKVLNTTAHRSSDKSIPDAAKAIAKKEAHKVDFGIKKAVYNSKKLKNALIISPIILVVLLLGITAALKIRDFARAQREEEYARQEAEMQAATFDFTILPGETISDIKKNLLNLDRNSGATTGDLLPNYTIEEINEAFAAEYNYSFFAMIPEGSSLEGLLYPETMNFYSVCEVSDIIGAFLAETERIINENDLINRYSAHGLSLYEGITLASVVQKEAPGPEMASVAGVFLNRLNYGMTLGSDVTVTYALDLQDPNREVYTDNSAALTIDSCYNTRIHGGLPCGPISNPGLTALLAVAEPNDTSYLYFLTGDDGMMYYSSTEYEHNQNIYSHCQSLCNVSL